MEAKTSQEQEEEETRDQDIDPCGTMCSRVKCWKKPILPDKKKFQSHIFGPGNPWHVYQFWAGYL